MADPGENLGKLSFSWVKRAVMIQLADGTKTQTQIAGEHGVTVQAIHQFAEKHSAEIQAIRDNQMDKYTGLTLVDKEARLAVYEQLLQACTSPTPKVAGKDGDYVRDPDSGKVVYEIDAGVAAKVLRNIAEELGHLPSRVVLTGGVDVRTNYTINGVEPDALK